jgi:hypothetical protein
MIGMEQWEWLRGIMVRTEPCGRKVRRITDITSTALGKEGMVVPFRREQCDV